MIDQHLSPAVIAHSKKDKYLDIATEIFRFIKNNGSLFQSNDSVFGVPLLLNHLKESSDEALFSEVAHELPAWIHSCTRALFNMKKDVDYIITTLKDENGRKLSKKIVIVDSHTGELKEQSRWHNRLHQFVEMKEGAEVAEESMTIAGITHPTFFNQYQKIYGLTGTIGADEERKEIESCFGVRTFDVPNHKPNQRKILSPKICTSPEAFLSDVLTEIKSILKQNRAVLIITPKIAASREIGQFLGDQGLGFKYLDGINAENDKAVVEKAGSSQAITITTNIGGRGTDIELSHECRKAGGLHVVLTFFPENIRIENQGIGRSARQGESGSSRMILPPDDEAIKELGKSPSFEALEIQRTTKNQTLSQQRVIATAGSNMRYQYLQYFFTGIKKWRTGITSEAIESINRELAINYHRQLGGNDFRPMIRTLAAKMEKEIIDQWADFFNTVSNHENQGFSKHPDLSKLLLTHWSDEHFREIKTALDKFFIDPVSALRNQCLFTS